MCVCVCVHACVCKCVHVYTCVVAAAAEASTTSPAVSGTAAAAAAGFECLLIVRRPSGRRRMEGEFIFASGSSHQPTSRPAQPQRPRREQSTAPGPGHCSRSRWMLFTRAHARARQHTRHARTRATYTGAARTRNQQRRAARNSIGPRVSSLPANTRERARTTNRTARVLPCVYTLRAARVRRRAGFSPRPLRFHASVAFRHRRFSAHRFPPHVPSARARTGFCPYPPARFRIPVVPAPASSSANDPPPPDPCRHERVTDTPATLVYSRGRTHHPQN